MSIELARRRGSGEKDNLSTILPLIPNLFSRSNYTAQLYMLHSIHGHEGGSPKKIGKVL